MKGTNIHTAFVSTNSICQGEQVPIFWKELLSLGVSKFKGSRSLCHNRFCIIKTK